MDERAMKITDDDLRRMSAASNAYDRAVATELLALRQERDALRHRRDELRAERNDLQATLHEMWHVKKERDALLSRCAELEPRPLVAGDLYVPADRHDSSADVVFNEHEAHATYRMLQEEGRRRAADHIDRVHIAPLRAALRSIVESSCEVDSVRKAALALIGEVKA
jgi:hypothetical protein